MTISKLLDHTIWMEVERITHAAIRAVESGLILFGKSHADCFHQAQHTGIKLSPAAKDQGFMTSRGRFVFRDIAARIAYEAGQTDPGISFLFSEDLWSPRSNGRHEYDSVRGYQLRK